jgi:predicted metal-binding membrane protein
MTQLALTARPRSRAIPWAVLAAVLAAAAVGWLALAERMAGMERGPGGDPGTLGWFTATWALMTAAMMLPAAAPAVLRVARASTSQRTASAASFVAGYGSVWILAGLAGYSIVQAARSLHVHALAWSVAGSYVAGAAIAAAGLYQLSAVKRRWLARCGDPDLARPRGRGVAAALRAGVEHGRCCLACCWTLMVALYALGMMSMTWTVVITAAIIGERLLPRRWLTVSVAAALIVLGVLVAVAPGSVPGLTSGTTMTMMSR